MTPLHLEHQQAAIRLLAEGRLEEASRLAEEALKASPALPEAWYVRGECLGRQGRFAESAQCMQRTLELDPRHAPAFHGLGVAHACLGNLGAAAQAYERAINLSPGAAATYRALANVHMRLGQLDRAIAVLERAVIAAPSGAESHHALGVAYQWAGRAADAARAFAAAVELAPDSVPYRLALAAASQECGRGDEAVAQFEAVLRLRPDMEDVRFYLAAATGKGAPPTAPPQYIARFFDAYSQDFEKQLVETLQYRAPQELADEILAATGGKADVVVDAGCGTGLCARYLRHAATRIIGVDLAPKMIEISRQSALYDELIVGDYHDVLRSHDRDVDVVVAGDVLIYVGQAEGIFQTSAQALRPGGVLAFSVEGIDGQGYLLRSSRRYAHSLAYLRGLANQFHFAETRVRPTAIRLEGGKGIDGWITLWRRQ